MASKEKRAKKLPFKSSITTLQPSEVFLKFNSNNFNFSSTRKVLLKEIRKKKNIQTYAILGLCLIKVHYCKVFANTTIRYLNLPQMPTNLKQKRRPMEIFP